MKHLNPVFITTCSKSKLGYGGAYESWPYAAPANSNLLNARTSLFKEIQRNEERHKLRGACLGPDFLEKNAMTGEYLPAFLRYARGNFMTSLEEHLGKELIGPWLDINGLYFISGLYGLVQAREPIQNYDIDMVGMAADYWLQKRNLLTECLMSNLQQDSVLLNCCGERRYANLVDWMLVESKGFQVYHAVDPHRASGQVRAEAGSFAAKVDAELIRAVSNGQGQSSGVNADIKFVSTNEFARPQTIKQENPTVVGVIDTGLNEYDEIAREAARQAWDRHFRFEKISTPEELAACKSRGINQCVCLIPPKGHKYLRDKFGGNEPADIHKGEMLMVDRPIRLSLQFTMRD